MNKVKILRKEMHLSQAELAERVGCSRSCISHYERGRNRPLTKDIPKLARALNCTVDELLQDESDEDNRSDLEDPEYVCGECMYISHGSVNYPRTCDLTMLYCCSSQKACSNFKKRGE